MSKKSILVVDDDKGTRDYLAAFLTSRGHAVECLGSGDEAIERLASGYSPSMILLDIVLIQLMIVNLLFVVFLILFAVFSLVL